MAAGLRELELSALGLHSGRGRNTHKAKSCQPYVLLRYGSRRAGVRKRLRYEAEIKGVHTAVTVSHEKRRERRMGNCLRSVLASRRVPGDNGGESLQSLVPLGEPEKLSSIVDHASVLGAQHRWFMEFWGSLLVICQ